MAEKKRADFSNGEAGLRYTMTLQTTENAAVGTATDGDYQLLLEASTEATLSFRDVCYMVNNRELLDSISGVARPGEFLAVMGPSGI